MAEHEAAGPGDGVVVAARAKVNLYLHVTGRRADGYHLLDSLVAFAGVGDSVIARPGRELCLAVAGPMAGAVPGGADNLVLMAARRLAEGLGVRAGADITLVKRLPVAAGLGGGSADAAATLSALMALWGLALDEHGLARLARTLGADVPVCLAGRASFVGGVGEELTRAPALPPAWLVLANPGVALATPKVFAVRTGPFSTGARFATTPGDARELARLLEARGNDLTRPASALVPGIDAVLATLAALPGALLARMSGSGATCFALFADAESSRAAARRLATARPDWWVAAAALEGERRDPTPAAHLAGSGDWA